VAASIWNSWDQLQSFSNVLTGQLPQERFELFNAGANTASPATPTGGMQLGIEG
jgi:hypothetical protein